MQHQRAGKIAAAIADVSNSKILQRLNICIGIVALIDMGIDSEGAQKNITANGQYPTRVTIEKSCALVLSGNATWPNKQIEGDAKE
jgi:hypothetical protein